MGQLLDPRSFGAPLHERIAARRSFGTHPLWRRISEGRVDRSGLQRFAVQFFLQVREFPRAVSALHTACPYAKERRMLAESLYEEETGLVSGCGLPHSEVPGAFGPFARAVQKHYGLSRQAVSFWDVHEIADREHSDVGDHIVVHFADTAELQQKVRDAVETSLDRWVAFFDDIDASLA